MTSAVQYTTGAKVGSTQAKACDPQLLGNCSKPQSARGWQYYRTGIHVGAARDNHCDAELNQPPQLAMSLYTVTRKGGYLF